MQDRTCSKCGSNNIYKNTGRNWYQDGLVLQMIAPDSFTYHFETEAFLCLNCRNLEIQVLDWDLNYSGIRFYSHLHDCNACPHIKSSESIR